MRLLIIVHHDSIELEVVIHQFTLQAGLHLNYLLNQANGNEKIKE